jgi:hypothetical protein
MEQLCQSDDAPVGNLRCAEAGSGGFSRARRMDGDGVRYRETLAIAR